MNNTLGAAVAGLMAASFLGFAVFLVLRHARSEPVSKLRLAVRGLRTPRQIDEYHLVSRIHDGQNSRVWEVYDEVSDEHVAMKVLAEAMASDNSLRKSLRHEWHVARQLNHPKVIQSLRFVEDKETAYIIMELFTSRNIKERILSRQKEFLCKHAASIMQQVAEALASMHAAGWVHRHATRAGCLYPVSRR